MMMQPTRKGDAYLECSAKELMGKLNEGNATLITCCSAMRQCMLSGDEMIVAPTGKKNVSTKMKIRYYLNDLETRESAYVPKKRGRKTGSTLKKTPGLKRNPKTGKMEAKFNKAYMTQSLQNWLDKKKLTYEELEDAYLVTDSHHGFRQIHLYFTFFNFYQISLIIRV